MFIRGNNGTIKCIAKAPLECAQEEEEYEMRMKPIHTVWFNV